MRLQEKATRRGRMEARWGGHRSSLRPARKRWRNRRLKEAFSLKTKYLEEKSKHKAVQIHKDCCKGLRRGRSRRGCWR